MQLNQQSQPVPEQKKTQAEHDLVHHSAATPPSPEPPEQTATERTFNIPELLHEILANVDPGTLRFSVKEVNKKWRAQTKTKRLRHAAIIRPIKPKNALQQYLHFRSRSPWYKSPWILWLHPSLAFARDNRYSRAARIDLLHQHWKRMRRYADEFVTLPPSSAVVVECVLFHDDLEWFGAGASSCTVFRPQGVRTGDLLDIAGTLEAQNKEKDALLQARISSSTGFAIPG